MRSIIVAFLCWPLVALAQDSLNITRVADGLFTWNQSGDIVIVDTLAYIPTGTTGLQILNIADLTAPRLIGRLTTNSSTNNLVIRDQYAYIADGPRGLRIADVSDPRAPFVVAEIDPSNSYYSYVALSGSYAYLINRGTGVHVLDVSNPFEPMLVSTFATESTAGEMVIVDTLAYVACGTGLEILRINTPDNLVRLSRLDLAGGVRLVVRENLLYIAGTGGLHVVDVLQPALPVLLATVPDVFDALDVTCIADRVYLTTAYGGVYQYDVSDPLQPEFVTNVTLANLCNIVASVGDTLFASGVSRDFMAINLADPDQPRLIGEFRAPEAVLRLARAGDVLYSVGSNDRLDLVDITNPAAPVVIEAMNAYGAPNAVAVAGDILLLKTSSNFVAADISDPREPIPVGGLWMDGFTTDMVIQGDYAYLATFDYFGTVDIADPMDPIFVDSQPIHWCQGVAANTTHVYLAEQTSIRVFSLNEPAHPQEIGLFEPEGPIFDVALAGNTMLVAEASGIISLNVTNPAAPQVLDTFVTAFSPTTVTVDGHLALVGTGPGGLLVLDISQPTALRELAFFDGDPETAHALRYGNFVFSAETEQLTVYDISAALNTPEQHAPFASAFTLNAIYPNPFNNTATISFDLPRAMTGRLAVYDVLGREVDEIFKGRFGAGTHSMQINGANLSSGTYFVQLASPQFTTTQKAVLVK
ncbi:MAG: T9SS type A sorting domain-containing protein [bacterium]|nr:T9SS type A sorting domain-containing protein [bacterium]